MGYNVLVINQQTRNPNRPSLTRMCDCGSGKLYKKCHGTDAGSGILTKWNEAFCLPTQGGCGQFINVSTQTNMTNMPTQSIDTTSESATSETSEQLTLLTSPTTTSSVEDSLASLFQSLENGEDLKIPGGQCSLKLREYCELNSLDYSYLKTLKDFSAMTRETLLRPSSPRLMSLGMTSNGKYVTLRTLESHKTGKECSLSDILEEHPDPKYFLSQATAEKILQAKNVKFQEQLIPAMPKTTDNQEQPMSYLS